MLPVNQDKISILKEPRVDDLQPLPIAMNNDQLTDWLWLEHLTNAFYALILVFWEPIYVACGFSLYLNRRTVRGFLNEFSPNSVYSQATYRAQPQIAGLFT